MKLAPAGAASTTGLDLLMEPRTRCYTFSMASKKTKGKKRTERTLKKSKSKPASRKKSVRRKKSTRRRSEGAGSEARIRQGVALGKAGQSGDVQGLSTVEDVDSESVEELSEEGQSFEAGVVDAVENAPDADKGEVRTREVVEDDVPPEYRDLRERED